MWDKWTFLATLAGITCLLRANLAEIAAAHATPLALSLYNECLAIAQAEGQRPASPPSSSSTSRFFPRPALSTPPCSATSKPAPPIESQQIIGDLLARARHYRLDTPLLTVAHAHLLAYEGRRHLRPS